MSPKRAKNNLGGLGPDMARVGFSRLISSIFAAFAALCPDMTRMTLRIHLLSIWAALAQIRPEWTSEIIF